ncbi:MAG: hypothetical protein ACKO14_09560 [Armatimonadota bacterium]
MSNDGQSHKVTRRQLAMTTTAFGAMVVLGGCGGGAPSGSRLRIAIDWGSEASRKKSRYIPAYAGSVAIEAYPIDKPNLRTRATVNRPIGPNSQFTTIVLPGVYNPGTYFVALSARSGENGIGEAVSTGGSQVELIAGKTSDLSITLVSVIKSLVIYGVDVRFVVGETSQLQGTALDPDGKVVLVPGNALKWTQVTGSTAVKLMPDGVVSALTPGLSNVRLEEVGAGVSAEARIEVVPVQQLNVWSQIYGTDISNNANASLSMFTAPAVSFLTYTAQTLIKHILQVSSSDILVVCENTVERVNVQSGIRLWVHEVDGQIQGCPAIAPNGRIVIPIMSGSVDLVNAQDGFMVRKIMLNAPVTGSVTCNGNLAMFGDERGGVHCIDTTTAMKKWSSAMPFSLPITLPPTFGAGGIIVANSPFPCLVSITDGRITEDIVDLKATPVTAVIDGRTNIQDRDFFTVMDALNNIYTGRPDGTITHTFEAAAGGFMLTKLYGNPARYDNPGCLFTPLLNGGVAIITEGNISEIGAGWLNCIPIASATMVSQVRSFGQQSSIAIVVGRQYIKGNEEAIGVYCQQRPEAVEWRVRVPNASGQAIPCGDAVVVPCETRIAVLRV